LKHFVGCAGWKQAGFYPDGLDPRDYLAHYSQVFDFVEVGVPAAGWRVLKRWAEQTPENFRFAVRLPRQATDGGTLGKLLEELAPIEEKILAVVVQAPAQSLIEGRRWLEDVLGSCVYHGYSAAVEFCRESWFQDMAYNALRKHGAALVWSDAHPHPVITSDFLYLRASGHKQEWVEKIKQSGCEIAAVVAGSPAEANSVLKLLGLSERKYAVSAPALAHAEPWPGRVVMCVDLNAFYPSCEELREPALAGKPHAVIMTDQKSKITKGVVSSCSYQARKFGIRSAMPLARALALCPDLVLRPVDMGYYKQVSEKVMGVLAQHADVLEQASIDEAFLDCTKAAADPRAHAAGIKKAIREQCGLLCSIGVAPSKSAAKMASDFKKPDGLTVVHPARMGEFLAPLEVGRISGVGPKTQQALKMMGIDTIGKLARYDVQKLTEKFGRNGLWMWQVANGSDSESVRPREDSVSLSTEHTLDEPTKDKEAMLAHLSGLVDELYGRVTRHGYAFRTVGVKLVKSDFTVETREVSFPDLQSDRQGISSVIAQLLDRFPLEGSQPVRKVGIRVTNLESVEKSRPQKTLMDYV
jgi:DNA polymerase IV (DinB-like DNA polymerase)